MITVTFALSTGKILMLVSCLRYITDLSYKLEVLMKNTISVKHSTQTKPDNITQKITSFLYSVPCICRHTYTEESSKSLDVRKNSTNII